VLSPGVGESPSGMSCPRPPVLNWVIGVGKPTPRMYWASRLASPESSALAWSSSPPLNSTVVNYKSVSERKDAVVEYVLTFVPTAYGK
jgi:hypothetical protein